MNAENDLLEKLVLQLTDAADPAAMLGEIRSEYPHLVDRVERVANRVRGLVQTFDEQRAGITIEGFQILEPLGEGGMGAVYLAEQLVPVQRRVAIKVIKRGMDSKQILGRFEAERQALARMEHENIARVFDAGTTEGGQPYFVMELVRGESITDYSDRHRLSVRERLHLFREVCAGVQHAHQKGVMHRDLKPSNVLITQQDSRAIPKIIDFGLARATDNRLVEHSWFTEHGQVLGTPGYMSPEQTGSSDIDTRTDVYSLGVLLYELLTGHLPLAIDLRDGGFLEMQRMIRDVDPPRPSTRISTTSEAVSELAGLRQLDERSFARCLCGDLDWITMKALEKERARRYATPDALAEDIRRHLEHEPVEAGPPTTGYRLKKFLRKRRGPVAGVLAVLVALAGGLWAALAQSSRATKAERLALDNLGLANDRLADYERMRDVPLTEDLLAEEESSLWPAAPDRLEEFDRWLDRAEQLALRAAEHRSTLVALRERARPPNPSIRERIAKLDELVADRDKKRSLMQRARITAKNKPALRRRMPEGERALRLLEGRVQRMADELEAVRWNFDDLQDRFLHGVFAGLVRNLERLVGPNGVLARVKARRERAATLATRSITAQKAEWDQTIASIGSSEKYRELPPLSPQLGLIPIGRDPETELFEFAVLESGRVPTRADDGKLKVDGSSAIVLVLIPPGEFAMGADASEDSDAQKDEGPVHKVTLAGFFLSKFEMTQGQYAHVMGHYPAVYDSGRQLRRGQWIRDSHPVENVTWHDAKRAVARLGLRMPTEAQWEYAARSGTKTPWWTGARKLSLRGKTNLADRFAKEANGPSTWRFEMWLRDGQLVHAPVGSYVANRFGLFDMIGNVGEWCRDRYGYYGIDKVATGTGERLIHKVTARADHVYRGGSFGTNATEARSSGRWRYDPNYKTDQLGIRPSRAIDQ